VISHPGALLGLPSGFIEDGAAARHLIMAAIALWALLVARGSRRGTFAGAFLFLALTIGVGVLSLGRPYGVLVDPEATRRAAQVATVASHHHSELSFVAGEVADADIWVRLVLAGVPEAIVQQIPTFLALLAPIAVAAVIGALWAQREVAPIGVAGFAVASNGALDALHGLGMVQETWRHPEVALALPPVVAVVLMAGRLPSPGQWPAALLAAGLLWSVPATADVPSTAQMLSALSFDQAFLLALAACAVRRRAIDPAALSLWLVGTVLCLAASLGLNVDGWGCYTLQRTGLVLLCAPTIVVVADTLTVRLARRWPGTTRRFGGIGMAALLLLVAPGCFLAWWNPAQLDPVAAASREPFSVNLKPAMEWIRTNTAPDAVVLASPAYSSAVSVLGARRVLRAGNLLDTKDRERRVRAEGRILRRRPLAAWVRAYGVTHVFAAPGDFRARGVDSPESLLGRDGLSRVYADTERFHVFAVSNDPPGSPSPAEFGQGLDGSKLEKR